MLAFHILCGLCSYCHWICPDLMRSYAEGSGVVFACLEAKGEGILSLRDEASTEVVEDMAEARNDTTSCVSFDLNNLFSSLDVVVFH
jgi:hypothetical protein